jgi:hypothetical protein
VSSETIGVTNGFGRWGKSRPIPFRQNTVAQPTVKSSLPKTRPPFTRKTRSGETRSGEARSGETSSRATFLDGSEVGVETDAASTSSWSNSTEVGDTTGLAIYPFGAQNLTADLCIPFGGHGDSFFLPPVYPPDSGPKSKVPGKGPLLV